ncbi:ubiquitin-activating emzyme E1 [Blastocystis sp. subtype 4]|uniref:ubiquitin-activating emzyme E1 n=1 Tax=Blastocystis sp. subtype 4 TaxID=944170 RepID=UPI000711E83A|nr:ubiquitin-activating emzyme E1 [Blastocystis sp. subtype 4]KNB45222.1 ubiquitin-activating emzyme E1 [Blastocystis sp. subtype 4]|eukprot:XP_014528665.1 ubiquitin-activating emzyme E1 [Blastocystis sp. subtype 4]
MKRMNASSALIIAKNIILAGVKTVAIYDNEAACIKDMSSNFYISEQDLGKSRAEVRLIGVCLPKLRELNSYVNVMRRAEDLTEEYIKSFRVGCSSNQSDEQGTGDFE